MEEAKKTGRPAGSKNKGKPEAKPEVPEVSTTAPKAEMIPVNKTKLDEILKRLREQEEQISILTDSVSRSRLEQAKSKRDPKGLKRCFLKVWKDKDFKEHIIVSWMSSQDNRLIYSRERPDFPIGEIIQGKYFYKDGGDTGFIDQVLFTRCEERAWAEIIKKRTDDDGNETLFLKMEDPKWGKEIFEISPTFVNP